MLVSQGVYRTGVNRVSMSRICLQVRFLRWFQWDPMKRLKIHNIYIYIFVIVVICGDGGFRYL